MPQNNGNFVIDQSDLKKGNFLNAYVSFMLVTIW